jgi:hypothetical protein
MPRDSTTACIGVWGRSFFAIAAISAKQAAETIIRIRPNRSPGRRDSWWTADRTSAKPVSRSDFVLPSSLKGTPSSGYDRSFGRKSH